MGEIVTAVAAGCVAVGVLLAILLANEARKPLAPTRRFCGSCRFFESGVGMCRRLPPIGVYTGRAVIDTTVWPVVRPEQDWCGYHEIGGK